MADDEDNRNANANNADSNKNRPPPLEIPSTESNYAIPGPKTPTPGPSSATIPTSATTVTVARSKSEREKKIGHRRVTEGGDVTYKKIQTSQLMGSIQLGIQHAVGGLASKPERDLLMQDFMTVEQTYFPSEGSNITQAHHYSDFRFKTYAPIAFRYFRDLFGIQPDDFLMSMCSVPMTELSNPGASGSIFYLTNDDEFIIKTVQLKECDFLQKLLPGYYMNLNQNPRTLLPKFFGLFCYQANSKNIRLVVMNNLLPSSVKMHQKYDLKGSTYKRKANKQELQKAYPTYKDLDFLEHHPDGILLEADTCAALIKTMQRDCRVLESFKIMDYSLLVGIHNLDIAAKEKAQKLSEHKNRTLESEDEDDELGDLPSSGLSRSKSINRQKLVAHSTALESIQAESEPIDAEEDVPVGGIPARNAKGERLLLFLGIIDILQSYRLKKKLEHTFKAMIHDGDSVSVHRPGFYAERFMNFMTKSVFRKIPSLDLPEVKGNHRKFRNLVSTYLALKHSPSKKRPPNRIRASGEPMENQDSYLGSPPKLTSPLNQIQGSATSSDGTAPTTKKPTIKHRDRKDSTTPAEITTATPSDNAKTTTTESSTTQYSTPAPQSQPTPGPSYPAVLRTPSSAGSKAKVPPPVPPRTPKRVGADNTATAAKGLLEGKTFPLQNVNDGRFSQGLRNTSKDRDAGIPLAVRSLSPSNHHSESETISSSEVYTESRQFRSNLSVASSSTTSGVSSAMGNRIPLSPPVGHDRTASGTPTWTEGTPSFTESSDSGDLGCPTTPIKGSNGNARSLPEDSENENENQTTRL